MDNLFSKMVLHEESQKQTGMSFTSEGQLVEIESIIVSSKSRTVADGYDHHSKIEKT